MASEASVKSVKLGFNKQSYKEVISSTAITGISEELNSDNSVADNTFLKEEIMLQA